MDKLSSSDSAMDRINERLARARDRYRTKLIQNLDELDALLRAGRDSVDALMEAQRLAHKIYGSAGTFGFSGVSEAIGAIDCDLLGVLSGRMQQTPELWLLLSQRMVKARELG
jgi:HPt (histidine-containing phosphotransfer) domain-containing protein